MLRTYTPSSPTTWLIRSAPINPAPPVTKTRIAILSSTSERSGPKHECRPHVFQRRLCPILLRKLDFTGKHRPLDPKGLVIPFDAPIAIRSVIVRHFVDHLGIRLKRTIAVCKADGDPNLHVVFRT